MVSGINAAASGMIAQQYNIDVISNNLANVNTPGFKELIPVFKSISDIVLKEKNKNEDSLTNTNTSTDTTNTNIKTDNVIGTLSSGSTLDSTILDLQPGAMKKTDNNLDFAINGKGFFVIGTDNGDCYTRNGSFTLSNDGTLVTKDGNPVLDEGGSSIKIDTSKTNVDKLNVAENGTMSLGKQAVGKLKIVEFNSPTDLISAGNTLYKTSDNGIKPSTAQDSKVNQGYLESSNSNVIGTMINTISATRTYESLAKVVKQTENTLSKAVNDVGRVKE
jgi:flagellar basal-body rod protein FlgF